MDDKGTTLIGVFGLYPAHENDPHLATQCAMEMVKRLSMLEMTPKIGVTTGTVFAAEVGNERRCEFAVIGDVVNLSARLMVAAAKLSKQTSTDINILCCRNTWKVAKTHVQFLEHKPIRVKGKSNLIDIFEPVAVGTGDDLGDSLKFIGHTEQMETCLAALRHLLVRGVGTIMLVVGNLGSGKTRFVHEVLRRQSSESAPSMRKHSHKLAKVHSIMTVADPINQFVPYSGIYEILLYMMKRLKLVEEFEDRTTGARTVHLKTRKTRVRNLLILDKIQLLNSVFPQLHPEVDPPLAGGGSPAIFGPSNSDSGTMSSQDVLSNEHAMMQGTQRRTSAMSAATASSDSEERRELFDQTRSLIFEIVHEYIDYRKIPIVLSFDDGQWLDAWSWSIIVQFKDKIVNDKWPILVIATTRATATVAEPLTENPAVSTIASSGSFDSDESSDPSMSSSSSPHKGSLLSLAVHNSASASRAASVRRYSTHSNSSWSSRITSMKMLHSGSIGKSLCDITSFPDFDRHSLSPEKSGYKRQASSESPSWSSAREHDDLPELVSTMHQDAPAARTDSNDTGAISSTYIQRLVSQKTGVLHITLKSLGKDDCGKLMTGVIGGTPPSRIVQHVMARTQGNPLYTIETTTALLASKFLILFQGECQITQELDAHDLGKGLPLPDTLQGILRSNIDRLKSSTQEILQLVSVACSNQSPADLELLYEMFLREQTWNTASAGAAASAAASINHSKVRDHVKQEVRNLVKSGRLISTKRSSTRRDKFRSASRKKRGASSMTIRQFRFALKELQEITYQISPFSVRQRLHLSAAVYHERAIMEAYGYGTGITNHSTTDAHAPDMADPVAFFTVNKNQDTRSALLESLSRDSHGSASLCTTLEAIAWHFEAAGKYVAAAGYVSCALSLHAQHYEYTKEVQLLRQMIRLCTAEPECGRFVRSFVTSSTVSQRSSSAIDTEHAQSPSLSILRGHLGKCLLHLGAFSEAEASLMIALEGMGHVVHLTQTWIKTSSERHTGRRSVTSLLATRRSRLSVFSRKSPELQNQRHRVENHVSSFLSLIHANHKSIQASRTASYVKMTTAQARSLECASALVSMAKVQHELNHPFRGLVVLYDGLKLMMSMSRPLPLLAEGLGTLASLASSVLQNEKLGSVAMSLAETVAGRVFDRPTVALIQQQQSIMSLSRADFNVAIKAAMVASEIYGDKALRNARAQEMVSLLLGDIYILQGRLWPSLSQYAVVLDSAQLRSDWKRQLSALVGQAFVHFVARNWDDASDAVSMCESLVTDIVAALDSATVITIRSFILLAEISQYKVDMPVLYSTIDMVLGDGGGSPELEPPRNSALSTAVEGDAAADDEGASRIAHRPFQYNHRSLFAYYAIIMSGVTILESYRLDSQHLGSSKTRSKMSYGTRKKSWFGNNARSTSSSLRHASSSTKNAHKDSASMWASAQRHLAYGLGYGITSHGQGIVRDVIMTPAQCKHLENRTYLLLKSMKQFVAQSYPVGLTMCVLTLRCFVFELFLSCFCLVVCFVLVVCEFLLLVVHAN